MLPWIRLQVARIYILTRREMILKMDESRFKTNCDFETAIAHYVDSLEGGLSPTSSPCLQAIYPYPLNLEIRLCMLTMQRLFVSAPPVILKIVPLKNFSSRVLITA